jgi:hypothetical protein
MRPFPIIILLLVLAFGALPACAAESPSRLLPVPSCGAGWRLEGKIALYDKETLSDRIDGEAELFFPYGFELLAYGRYVQGANAFDLDVYRLGSLLDAFGMYANYRPDGASPLPGGIEGAVTPSQLFSYQDRYFIRMQSTGRADAGAQALTACSQLISSLLPVGQERPGELELLAIPEVDKASVRYSATSLLGYDFFPRGMMADAAIAGEPARVFILLADSASEAAKAFNSYRAYLQEGGGEVRMSAGGKTALTGTDPLYGKVLAEQTGRYVFGLARVKDAAAASPVMDKLRAKLRR